MLQRWFKFPQRLLKITIVSCYIQQLISPRIPTLIIHLNARFLAGCRGWFCLSRWLDNLLWNFVFFFIVVRFWLFTFWIVANFFGDIFILTCIYWGSVRPSLFICLGFFKLVLSLFHLLLTSPSGSCCVGPIEFLICAKFVSKLCGLTWEMSTTRAQYLPCVPELDILAIIKFTFQIVHRLFLILLLISLRSHWLFRLWMKILGCEFFLLFFFKWFVLTFTWLCLFWLLLLIGPESALVIVSRYFWDYWFRLWIIWILRRH